MLLKILYKSHYISAHFFGDTWYLEEESFRLIISVLTVMPLWIIVTFLTAPEPPEVRRRFYARALPFGWWPEEVKYFNYQKHHIIFPWKRLACALLTALAGILLIVGFTKLVFGEAIGWVYIPPALLLGFLVFKLMKKINFTKEPVPKELYDAVFKDYEYIEIFAETSRGKTRTH